MVLGQISAVIFDLDGTLINSLDGLVASVNAVLRRQGFPEHPKERIKTFIGNGLFALMQRALPPETAEESIDSCCLEFKKVYAELGLVGCRPYAGVDNLLRHLQRSETPFAVLSNKPHEFTGQYVKKFFPETCFSCIYGLRPGFRRKPHPDSALEIAEIMNCKPDLIAFVGDSEVDIQTGKNANMQTIAVSWGYQPLDRLEANRPDYLIHQPKDLLDYVFAAL
ncbi:MAG: hypothetical protein CSA20_05275 [Deltaproteobacteria bacterium]|nr:MAG: hypothetical protein CSA20_05275 [Deltaproteobacteria bacterium]